jgi:hypothetical protein
MTPPGRGACWTTPDKHVHETVMSYVLYVNEGPLMALDNGEGLVLLCNSPSRC